MTRLSGWFCFEEKHNAEIMSLIQLKNEYVTVIVDVGHGAEIVQLTGLDGINILSAPNWMTPLPARSSQSYGSQTLDWLSEYRGGWQELFPNAGAACEVMGVPLPFHGEGSRARWDMEWIEQDCSVLLRCPARLPLVLTRRMRLDAGRPVLYLEEEVLNESAMDLPFLWGHHPAFGPP